MISLGISRRRHKIAIIIVIFTLILCLWVISDMYIFPNQVSTIFSNDFIPPAEDESFLDPYLHINDRDIESEYTSVSKLQKYRNNLSKNDTKSFFPEFDLIGKHHPEYRGPKNRHAKPVVPNIAHYIWFGNHTFRFDHLISILSAHKFMKPDKIMFHTDCEPEGGYWEEVKERVGDVMQIIKRERPRTIFNNLLTFIEHSSDVARLEILTQYGGIYMDMDIIVLKSLTPLRHYDFVMGRESQNGLNNGIIISSTDSKFLQLYYQGYIEYSGDCWNCDSIWYPNELSKLNPNLIHVERTSLVHPTYTNRDLIFFGHFQWWKGHYTIHTWIRMFFERAHSKLTFTRDNILSWDSAFGEICRYVYYGNADMLGKIHNADDMFWTHIR